MMEYSLPFLYPTHCLLKKKIYFRTLVMNGQTSTLFGVLSQTQDYVSSSLPKIGFKLYKVGQLAMIFIVVCLCLKLCSARS